MSGNLPGNGLIAGIFNGQVVLTAGTDRQTIPVTVVVGANVLKPVSSLSFATAYGSGNLSSQVLTLASTGTNFNILGLEATAKGGSWLGINPSAYGYGISTPFPVTVSVHPATNLAAGSYVGEAIFTSAAGDQGMVVPVTLTVEGSTAAATPTFSPPGGVYTAKQTVTISDTTIGAAIYYTLNGSAPTTSSPVYSTPVTVTPPEVINAIAVAPGYLQSADGKATYSLPAAAATPVFKPAAGTYTTPQSVTITDATPGAVIYYTINGTAPTTASTKYTGAIAVSETETIKAIAVAPDYTESAVASATYTFNLPTTATPVVSQTITIAEATSGAVSLLHGQWHHSNHFLNQVHRPDYDHRKRGPEVHRCSTGTLAFGSQDGYGYGAVGCPKCSPAGPFR